MGSVQRSRTERDNRLDHLTSRYSCGAVMSSVFPWCHPARLSFDNFLARLYA